MDSANVAMVFRAKSPILPLENALVANRMPLLLKRFLLFVSPLTLIFLGVEIYLRAIDTSYTEKDRELTQADPEVLILGNSHAAYGVNPNVFSREAFNAANVAQSIYFDKRITLKHLPHLKKLKYVLISIDYHSLYFSSQGGRDIWTYLGYGIPYKNSLTLAEQFSYLMALKAKVAYNFYERNSSGRYDIIRAIDVEYGVDVKKPIEKGWFYYVGLQTLEAEKIASRMKDLNAIVHNPSERAEVLADLEDFITQLQSRGVTPILFTPPCYPELTAQFDSEVTRQNQIDIGRLTKKYNIEYWDYLNFPLPETAFFNSDHLNYEGATIFSKALNARLNRVSKI